ncbi:MAG: extracellular solute-binding protein, partial [Marmoricola sp.]
MTSRSKAAKITVAFAAVTSLALSGCGAGGGGSASDTKSINVLMVGNPQMADIRKLTKDSFTKDTGIKVNYTILPENELRDKVTQDVATKAGQYDVATIGAYEVPIWSKNGWLTDLGPYADKDTKFDKADLIKAHGEPGAAQAGFTECLNAMSQNKVAMWYDATSAAGSLEDPKVSKVAGKVGYAFAPTKVTDSSGWLWAWAWAMPKTTKKADSAAKFMLW